MICSKCGEVEAAPRDKYCTKCRNQQVYDSRRRIKARKAAQGEFKVWLHQTQMDLLSRELFLRDHHKSEELDEYIYLVNTLVGRIKLVADSWRPTKVD